MGAQRRTDHGYGFNTFVYIRANIPLPGPELDNSNVRSRLFTTLGATFSPNEPGSCTQGRLNTAPLVHVTWAVCCKHGGTTTSTSDGKRESATEQELKNREWIQIVVVPPNALQSHGITANANKSSSSNAELCTEKKGGQRTYLEPKRNLRQWDAQGVVGW